MKYSKNDDVISLMDICNHVWQAAGDQLARPFYATRPAHAWMIRKHLDPSNDIKHRVDGGVRVVATDISFDRLEILASGARPL